MLTLGQTPSIPVVSKVPTIILGMGALFGFPEQSDVLSIAAMVSSRQWPLISSYGASGRTQDGVSESQFNQVLIKLLRLASSLTRSGTLRIVVIVAGFLADDLQEFVHSLSYMYQRSTTAIFVVAPICYAHLAASQLGAIYED
ncbi:hypothetical protein CXB51_011114 [Gossypium anomalum]|uniref:Piwi domain-containing protein n=1 Tax=Gossypium anomalum TaxID=47600 RepID=A0A8J6D7A7_9ROSI|nr:hypothetical protein CXB51_011114 [Gossypium anomalum]